MTNLYDMVDGDLLSEMLIEGYVRERFLEPDVPEDQRSGYSILNYAEKAQYSKTWNEVTEQCRGLITDGDGNVVARPWRKFFNVGEHDGQRRDELDLDAPVEITDKMDGSLGILYTGPDGRPAIATRGSFHSDQARFATALYRERYEGKWLPEPGLTYLFEIIYPENRIVLDYGDQRDLVLLGSVEIDTGLTVGPKWHSDWPGPIVDTFPERTLREALALPPRKNAEGLVVRYVKTGLMVKIKQEDYVRLHRIVTGLNEVTVWEALLDQEMTDLMEQVPDEFHDWVRVTAERLQRNADFLWGALMCAYANIKRDLPEGFTQKDFALAVQGFDWDKDQETHLAPHDPKKVGGILYQIHAGRDPWPAIWKNVRPRGDTFAMDISEDVA